MTRARMIVGVMIVHIALVVGCTRSPEARRDRYLAQGKEFLQKRDYSRAVLAFKNAANAMPKDPEPYYQWGLAASASSDIRTAVVAFRKTLDLNPKHAGAQLKMAQIMVSATDSTWLTDAEARLKTLTETSPVTPEVLNTLALTKLRLGKKEDAVRSLERLLANSPKELSSSILLARAKLLSNDIKGAEEVLKTASKAAPDAAEPSLILGDFYLSQNRPQDAEAEFQNALKINQKSGPALMSLARLQHALGRQQEAELNFKRLAGFGEKAYEPMYGMFLFEVGRREEAIREFERLVAQHQDDREARTRLVAAYKGVNRMSDAQKILDVVLAKNPKDLDALLQRGDILVSAGKYPQAEADLNRVLHLDPNSADVHYALAKLNYARGATRTYRQELSEALRLNPYLLNVRVELAQHLVANKDGRAALELLNAAPESQRDSVPILVQRNWALWAVRDFQEMRKSIDTGLSRERSTDLLLQDGIWKLQAGNPSGARASLEEALKINPSDLTTLGVLKQTYDAQKQSGTALQKVKEYAVQQPKSAPVQYFLGTLLIGAGDRSQARAAFMAAKAADPQFLEADLSLVRLDMMDRDFAAARKRLAATASANEGNPTLRQWSAVLAQITGDHKAAMAAYRKVLESHPDDAQALNNLAYLLAEHGDNIEEALKYAQKAVELAPERPAYCDTLGWILYRKGLYSLAVQYLEKADSASKSVVSKYHLAMAYTKAGDRKRGQTTLAAALQVNANVPEAQIAKSIIGTPQ